MTTIRDTNPGKLGTLPYVIGSVSFIPLFGVLFGIVAVVWGLSTKRPGGKWLAAIGAGGISFTFFIYGGLFYLGTVQRGGAFDELRVKLTQSAINSLVPSIELYKIQNGRYPDSLEVLQQSMPKDNFAAMFVTDPSVMVPEEKPRYFFYEKVGEDHYYLRGLGPDGKPFTTDDVVPQISSNPDSKLGLLIEKQAGS